MTLGEIKIDVIVPRRDRHDARAEFRVDSFIFYDRRLDRSIDPLDRHLLAMGIFRVSLVLRMHHDVFVAEFCLRTGGADFKWPVREGVERLRPLLVFDFVVADGGLELGIPVHDAVTTVNELITVHFDEYFVYAAVEDRVHRVPLARPVAGRAHFANLAPDGALAHLDEGFDFIDERFAAELRARILHLLLLLQLLDDETLCRDRGVIGPGNPKDFLPAHSLKPDEDILQREHHRMSKMQLPRRIRRRHRDGK